jgi:hypothetical protein
MPGGIVTAADEPVVALNAFAATWQDRYPAIVDRARWERLTGCERPTFQEQHVQQNLHPDSSSLPSGAGPGGWLFNTGVQNDGQTAVKRS